MKNLKFFLFAFLLFLLPSCSNVEDTGGLWVIPGVLILASLYSGFVAFRGWQSGAQDGGSKVIPKGPAVYAVAFLIAAVGTFFMIKSDYAKATPERQKRWDKKWEKYKEKYGGVGDTSAYDTANYR